MILKKSDYATLDATLVSSVKQYSVELLERSQVVDFIEQWHYTSSINGLRSSFCFGLIYEGHLIGVAIYGAMGMANTWKKYADSHDDIIELRRLALIDKTLKNAESYFIGQTLKWLQRNTNYKSVISYADTHYGHEGTVYKATNFELVGKSQKTKVIVFGDKVYHDRAARTKYAKTGELKPFAAKIKEALKTGEAYYETRPEKNIYLLRFKDKKMRVSNR